VKLFRLPSPYPAKGKDKRERLNSQLGRDPKERLRPIFTEYGKTPKGNLQPERGEEGKQSGDVLVVWGVGGD